MANNPFLHVLCSLTDTSKYVVICQIVDKIIEFFFLFYFFPPLKVSHGKHKRELSLGKLEVLLPLA